jgi:hypothetical protein
MDTPNNDPTPEDEAAFARLPLEKRLTMRGAIRMAEAIADLAVFDHESANARLAQAEADFADANLMGYIRARYSNDPDPLHRGMVAFAEHMLGGA